MKKIFVKRVIWAILITTFLVSTASAYPIILKNPQTTGLEDFDPLVDIEVTVEIQKIRSLEKFEYPHPRIEKIDWFSDPDFYVKVFINDEEFESNVWNDIKYIYDPQFSPTLNVPDDEEFVNIKIQLWDWNSEGDKLCDIGSDKENCYDVELTYSVKTGHWSGDDEPSSSDPSGYGRLNGCDDGTIYKRDLDCELWFNIYQNDYDGDSIPYWTEVNVYETDPEVDNTGEDADNDSVPIEWEHKWGYDPFDWDNHEDLDPDIDGIENIEEYLTSQWDSDPFREDIFIELDQMEESPEGFESLIPEGAKELLRTAFNRYNIVLHLDDGCMGGGEMIPFDELTPHGELRDIIYWNYFLHGDENNWRRGVFRYGVVVYDAGGAGYNFRRGAFVISSISTESKAIPNTQRIKDIVYASVYMHETGHTLGIYHGNTPGCDAPKSARPRYLNFWRWGPYKSTMNYRYTYRLVDYSDGSRGRRDFNDWDQLDFTHFQSSWP